MPNPNAVVSSVLRVELDSIELGNQRRVRLDPERRDTRNLLPILEGLSRLRKPVYLEKATWKGVQHNPNATLTDTPWTYFRKWGETDPTFSKTNGVLADYRLELMLRSLSSVGPPPYANCP